MRDGTRKSRAPSGLEAVRIGVWNSKKPALCLHPRAQRVDDLAAQHDVLMQLLAPQIEEAVAQPHVLGIILLAEHRHGQFGGGSQNLDSGDIDFDEAGRHFGFSVPAGRFRTAPSPCTTHSDRSFSAWANTGEPAANTHCVTP